MSNWGMGLLMLVIAILGTALAFVIGLQSPEGGAIFALGVTGLMVIIDKTS